MSDINYDIYGAPEDWTHWQGATPQSGTYGTLWGQQRIGASDWTNADFTDYPEFLFGQQTIYRNYKDNNLIDINEALDNSIAYSAMANPDLPQQNVMIFDINHSTISDPVAQTNAAEPSPFAFSWYYYGTSHISNPGYQGSLYGFDGFPNNAQVFSAQGMQRQAPYALWDSTYTNTWGKYNPNLRIAPCVKFGVKSIILEIKVIYRTTGDYPITETTLKDYLNHTATWLQEHKLIAAFCQPYYRSNVDGSYTATNAATATDRFGGISTLFFRPYNLQGIDIYNYTAYLSSDLNISGNLPIYGSPVTDGFWTSLNVYGYHSYDNPTDTNMNSYACLFGTNRGELVKTVTESQLSCHMELDMSIADNVEYIMRGAAAYGLFFCKAIGTLGSSGRDSGPTERWLDEEMYCGVIAADGCTYGDYTQGEGNKDNQIYSWTDSTQTPYVPGSGTDPNAYSNKTKFNILSNTCSMARHYVLNGANVLKLAADLWSITAMLSDNQTDFEYFDGKIKDEFLTNDPIDCIISLRRFPFDIPYDSGDGEYIKLGKTSGSAYGYTVANHPLYFNFRSVKIYPRFGNSFLDYSPYTEYELYVPFCGTTKLDAGDILGHTLNVRLVVDITTGSCTGYIMADDLVIQSVTGSIAIEIPITGTDAATLNSQIMNGIITQYHAEKQERLTFASQLTPAGLFKNLMSLGTSAQMQLDAAAAQTDKANYDLTHIQAPIHKIGTATAGEKWAIDLQCRLLIYYPEGSAVTSSIPPSLNSSVIEKYGAVQGFATVELGNVEDYSGLLSGISPRLENIYTANGEPASSEELKLIGQAIQEGIII